MKQCVRILGSLVLLGILVWKVDLTEIGQALGRVGWGWFTAALALYVLAQLISSVRWRALARPVGFNEPIRRYTAYYFIGNFFNMLLPTSIGGDVVRAWYLDAGAGRRWLAFLTVLADRLNGLFVLVALACVAAMVVPLPAWVVAWTAAAGGCAMFGLALLLWLGKRNHIRTCSSSLAPPLLVQEGWRATITTPRLDFLPPEGGEKKPGRVRKVVGELAQVSRIYGRAPQLLTRVTMLSVIVQVANVILVWFLGLALGANVPLDYCFVFVPLVTLLTLAPVSVNGMGVREGGTVLLLAPLGVPAEQAVTLSLLWFSVFTLAGLLGAGCYLLGQFPRYEVSSDAGPVGSHSDQGRARQPQAAA